MSSEDKIKIRLPKEQNVENSQESKKHPGSFNHRGQVVKEHDNSSFSNLLSQIDGNNKNNDRNNK